MCAYFWIKHIGDSIHRSVQQEASDEENKENHVGEDGGEVHHLKFRKNKQYIFLCQSFGFF